MSKTFCPLPWIHLGTHPHGGVTPCCISDHTLGRNRARNFYYDTPDPNIVSEDGNMSTYVARVRKQKMLTLNENTIEEHMNSDYFKEVRLQMLNNIEPAACKRCYEEERNELTSKRQHEAKQYPTITSDWARTVTEDDGTIPMDLHFVELRLGNLCNVRCRTCNPASSSRWVSDYKKIVDSLDFINDGYSWLDHKRDFLWPDNDEFYEDLFECAPNMKVLYINGGEPTLIQAHWDYLQKLIESDRAKDIILWYNINMTNLPDYAIDIWKEFKEARINPSIDDLGHRNNFIRYPTDWITVEENLDKLLAEPKLNVRITQTVSAYNFIHCNTFHDWAPCPVDINFVYDPSYLSPWVLPSEIRKDPHVYMWELVQYTKEDKHDALGWEHFCRYNDELDKIRKQDWRNVFPELINKCEKLGITHEFK